jgi:hypothetical protein
MATSTKPLTLTIPATCHHCGAPGSVKLLTKVTAADITFRWFCANCEHGWSATPSNEGVSWPLAG